MSLLQETAAAPDTAELRARFRGALLRPGEEGYDEARRVWNGAIDRHPALIARCAGADDVAEAVRFARERDLLVAVKGGGQLLPHERRHRPERRRAMTILVTGATGNVGSRVVKQLIQRGASVRAFVRDPERAGALLGDEVELAVGDFADPDSLRRALAGADRLFLSCANVPAQVDFENGAIDVATETGVERIVKLSASVAAVDSPLLFPRWHGMIERHLRRSDVPAVLICPGFL